MNKCDGEFMHIRCIYETDFDASRGERKTTLCLRGLFIDRIRFVTFVSGACTLSTDSFGSSALALYLR